MSDLIGWLFALILFPGVGIGFAAILHFGYGRRQSRTFLRHGVSFYILLGIIFTYLVTLAATFWDPFWDDAGARTRIYFPEHFAWAWLGSFIYQFIIIPPFVILYWVATLFRCRKAEQGAAANP